MVFEYLHMQGDVTASFHIDHIHTSQLWSALYDSFSFFNIKLLDYL